MPTIRHLITHIKKYGKKHSFLYIFASMVMFWTVFEGIVAYIAPILIISHGISKSMMGLILGLSSVAGGLLDFLICRYIKNVKHRRLLLIMFLASAIQLFVLWHAETFGMYLIAMVLWGLYFDLHNISKFEYVSHSVEKEEYASSFGLVSVFQAIGYFFAPILAGFLIAEKVGNKPFALALIFLLISAVFFVILMRLKDAGISDQAHPRRINLVAELRVWKTLGGLILPVLILTTFLNIFDAFFWTIGPIWAESFSGQYHQFAGFLIAAYTLPALIGGWMVGALTASHSKKRSAFFALLGGSAFLTTLSLFAVPAIIIIIIFISSFFISMAWPAISGAYADYISESLSLEREIEGLQDFATNLGYVIGPILAGFLADQVGNKFAFVWLGFFGAVVAILLLTLTPRKIQIKPRAIFEENIKEQIANSEEQREL